MLSLLRCGRLDAFYLETGRSPVRALSGVGGAVLALTGSAALGATLAIKVSFEGDAAACSESTLVAEPVVSDDRGEATRRTARVTVPGSAQMTLRSGAWRLSLEALGCWAPPSTVVLLEGGALVRSITVWPEAEIWVRLDAPAGEVLPDAPRLFFSPSFREAPVHSESLDMHPRGDVPCLVKGHESVVCRPPQAVVDLRLAMEGFAPHYWWRVDLTAAKAHRLGAITLKPGASLAGWLVTNDGEAPNANEVEVTIVPRGLADSTTPEGAFQGNFATHRGKLHASGFVQFDSVPWGEYLLVAKGGRYAETRMPVLLLEGRESNLREPIVLSLPLKVAFVIEPATPPNGGNWRITIRRINRYRTFFDTIVDDVEVSADGWFETTGLEPGVYLAMLKNERGDGVLVREVDLVAEHMPISLEVQAISVSGRLLLGKKPLAGTIYFGGRTGGEKVTTTADEEGSYATTLPRNGSWRVDIESTEPPVKRRLPVVEVPRPKGTQPVRVDLELPDTRVFGVVREIGGGRPRSSAIVYAAIGPDDRTSQRVEEEGRFDFHGLAVGSVRVHARSADAVSKTATVQTKEDSEQELTLILEPQTKTQGVVVGPAGPVPGATVVLVPEQDPVFGAARLTCDASGRFTTALPKGSKSAYATVSALGYTLGVFRVELDGNDLVLHLPKEGGQLLIKLPKEPRLNGAITLYLRNGIPFALGEVETWAALHPGNTAGEPDVLVVPDLVEGNYEVCSVSNESYPAWALGFRDRNRCASTALAVFGDVELAVPDARLE